jgi:hypothetical protein
MSKKPYLANLVARIRGRREQLDRGRVSGGRPAGDGSHFISLRGKPWAWPALLLAWVLIGAVLWRLPRTAPDGRYGLLFLGWLLACSLYVVAFFEPRPRAGAAFAGRFAFAPWKELSILGGIVLLAVGSRLWDAGTIPHTLAGDEASQGLEALRTISGDLRNPFGLGWLSVPNMSFFYDSLGLRIFGQTIFGLRFPWVLMGAACIPVAYFLVARLRGPRLGFAAATLLATYHFHIHFSRLGSAQIADPLLAGLAVLFLVRALADGKATDWALMGLTAGLAFYFYAGARFVPILLMAVLLYNLVIGRRTFLRRHWGGILVGSGAFLIGAAPMLQFAVRFPAEFNGRLNMVGILQSGWLEREVVIRAQSTLQILFDQFRRAFLAFNFYPDRTVWYGLPTPLLDPLFGSLFLLGLGYATVQIFRRGGARSIFPFVAWWWGGIILGGMMTESPPSSMRLTTLAVPTCFLVAYGMWLVIQLAALAWRMLPRNAVLCAGVGFFALISLKTYFLDFTPQRLYGGGRAEMATEMAPLLNEMKQEYTFLFVGPPWMYWGFATIPYLAPDARGMDVLDPIAAPPTAADLPADGSVAYIFVPERFTELEYVQEAFPDGSLIEVRRDGVGRLLGLLYLIPGGASPAGQ